MGCVSSVPREHQSMKKHSKAADIGAMCVVTSEVSGKLGKEAGRRKSADVRASISKEDSAIFLGDVFETEAALAARNSDPLDFTAASAPSLQSLFEEQHRIINHFFDNVDYEQLAAFSKAVLECTGKVLFTGVGKSGFIAQKITQTLVSTGTKAVFLHPVDALHGDIGIVSRGDVLVCFSKSGATEELLRLVPFAKAKGAKIVSVTSIRGCQLDQACDMVVTLPLLRELCPFNLAPVTSTCLQMLFGDTLAISFMQARHLTKDEYAQNHPAGRIGKRLMLRVVDVMLKGDELPLVTPDMLMADVLMVLTSKGCGCVLVASQEGELLGMFTDGDLRRTIQTHNGNIMGLRVGDIMTREVRQCASGDKAVEAMQAMEANPKVSAMPVVQGGKLVGLITLHVLVSAGL